MSRYARKQDANHRAVVNALRVAGASVEAIQGARAGLPDLIVGVAGVTELVEVKPPVAVTARRELRDSQSDWHAAWRGRRPVVLRTTKEAFDLVARLRGVLTSKECDASDY